MFQATIISVVTGMATGHNSTVNIVFALIICSLVLMTDILMAHMLPVDFTRRSISKAVIVLVVLLFVGSITWLPIDTASNDRNDPIVSASNLRPQTDLKTHSQALIRPTPHARILCFQFIKNIHVL